MTGRGAVHRPLPPGAAEFDLGRAEARRAQADLQVRAARTVAQHALSSGDRDGLLAMLDLPEPTEDPVRTDAVLDSALREYVHAVADALGVPRDGVTCEVTDTVTAYLPLACRTTEHPDDDLMLVWGERRGWAVLVETAPGRAAVVLGAIDGDTVVHPADVARFLTATVRHPHPGHPVTTRSGRPDRARLAARLRCATP